MYTSYLNKTEHLKLVCSRECLCGHPKIMPEHWLDAMVSGGFKVWQLISLLVMIAFGLLLFCCCCCEQRFRIPRTKEEIELNSIRTKLTKRFHHQLKRLTIGATRQPTTFREALKLVRELEEDKSAKEERPVDIQEEFNRY